MTEPGAPVEPVVLVITNTPPIPVGTRVLFPGMPVTKLIGAPAQDEPAVVAQVADAPAATPTPKPMIKVGTEIMSYTDTDLISGYVLDRTVSAVAEKNLPPMRWKGGKLPLVKFRQILSFFYWVNETHHTEATARLFYNVSTKEWEFAVLPQKICGGLAAKELTDTDEACKIIAAISVRGYENNGSIHSHCGAGAFMSGTDENDERNDTGFHITLGHLPQPIADLHCRFSSFKLIYPVIWDDWFEGDINRYLVLTEKDPFPEEWKTMMRPEPATQWSTSTWRGGRQTGYPWCGGTASQPRQAHSNTRPGKSKRWDTISTHTCEHRFIPNSLDPCDFMVEVFQTLFADVAAQTKGTDPKFLNTQDNYMLSYVVQYAVAAVMAARVREYISEQQYGSRSSWRGKFSALVGKIDTVLDKYNPAFELLAAGSMMFDGVPAAAAETVFTNSRWEEDLLELVKKGFFTKEIAASDILETLSEEDLPPSVILTANGLEEPVITPATDTTETPAVQRESPGVRIPKSGVVFPKQGTSKNELKRIAKREARRDRRLRQLVDPCL